MKLVGKKVTSVQGIFVLFMIDITVFIVYLHLRSCQSLVLQCQTKLCKLKENSY